MNKLSRVNKSFLALLTTLFIHVFSFAQNGKVSGKVFNAKNEPLAGVSIKIVEAAGGTSTDFEGRYTLTLPAGKKYELTFSAIGYDNKNVSEVEMTPGLVIELNVNLEILGKNLEGVTVTATRNSARKETINSVIQFQKNTNTVAAVISAESIRRSPDKNTGEVLKRVPGTSVQEGKYLVVRGLSDRYNTAMLNGVQLSSTEPDRKSFSFDIFPSSMVDNIIINKAFVPEYPGEWAGGLVQVNTKDIPSQGFLNVQIGTGFNTNTLGKDFYTYEGGKLDFLGFDDGTRTLPDDFPSKSEFNLLTPEEKTNYGRELKNIWSTNKTASTFLPLLNTAFQFSGGFNKDVGRSNKLGGVFAVTYNRTIKTISYENRIYSITNQTASLSFDYDNEKYSQDVLWGILGNVTLQAGKNNKISFRNILNVNTTDYAIKRTGKDFENNSIDGENIRATELAFRSNTFFNTQLSGEHNLPDYKTKLHWYGSFNILDQYVPDQRRIQYNQDPTIPNAPYYLLVSASQTSQKSGSRYFGYLSDYIYNAGGDITKYFSLFGNSQQTVKGGYLFQVKDRLFDSKPFSIYLPGFDPGLQSLPEETIFSPENLGPGKYLFNEINDARFRYLANTILNAAYIQFDNQFAPRLRATWGLRWENFDQLIGSVKQADPRHVHSQVNDFLPGANITYKLNDKTNIRLSGSQTVVRPEFRELSPFAFFDFELGATVTGNKELLRTKVTNFDLRYELYPRAGEVFTVGVFYKYFKNPIELFFNQSGAGSSSTFNYINADDATGFGAELEFRKKLDFINNLQNFTFQSNLSYIYNRVRKENAKLDRPMQGQSPYLINAALQYDVEKAGLNLTLLYNQIGRRILYVGNQDFPPVWEGPRPLLDFQIAKKVIKRKGELKLNVSDIFNRRAYFYHDIDDNGTYGKTSPDALAINRKYGTNVNLAFSYVIK